MTTLNATDAGCNFTSAATERYVEMYVLVSVCEPVALLDSHHRDLTRAGEILLV